MIQQMIADVLKREGGYINHPRDKGGPTNYGITQETLSNYLGRHCTIADIKALSKKTAADIYEHHYFIKSGIEQLPTEIQPLLFDMAVNHGNHNAIKMLQRELREYGYDAVGKVDGVIGNLTIGATQAAIKLLGKRFINALVTRRINFYRNIVDNHPEQVVFLNGWINRANSFHIN